LNGIIHFFKFIIKFRTFIWLVCSRIGNGNIFIIGGTAYLILHLINSAYLKEPVVGSTVAIAGGIALGGVLMHVARKQRYNIGRNYSLKYVPM